MPGAVDGTTCHEGAGQRPIQKGWQLSCCWRTDDTHGGIGEGGHILRSQGFNAETCNPSLLGDVTPSKVKDYRSQHEPLIVEDATTPPLVKDYKSHYEPLRYKGSHS